MAHAQPRCRPDPQSPPHAIGRRHFLCAGAACCVPLMAGAALGQAASTWAGVMPAQEPEVDAILDHIGRELVRVGQRMQGVGGVKGEHVRALAANLDLMAAHLVQTRVNRRMSAALQDGISRLGRDVFTREISGRHLETALETGRRCGLSHRMREDLDATGMALNLACHEDITSIMRKTVPRLARLADRLDRRRPLEDHAVRLVGQKPGDDFGGSWGDPPPLTCKDLKVFIYLMGISSAVLGMFSFGVGSGIYAIFSILGSMLYDGVCMEAEAEAEAI